MERTLGWRHFEAVQKRGQGREAYVLLESTCNRDTKLWVSRCGSAAACSRVALVLLPLQVSLGVALLVLEVLSLAPLRRPSPPLCTPRAHTSRPAGPPWSSLV